MKKMYFVKNISNTGYIHFKMNNKAHNLPCIAQLVNKILLSIVEYVQFWSTVWLQ